MATQKQIAEEKRKIASGKWIRCWACNSVISLLSRIKADGDCPKCRNEICLGGEEE
jgi:hypothetical protein